MTGQPGWPGGFPGGFDPSALGDVFGRLQRIFSGPQDDGPVNWRLAREVALETLAGNATGGGAVATQGPRIGFGSASPAGLPVVGGPDTAAVADAANVANLWLDAVSAFPAAGTGALAWTPQQWLDRTLPTWRTLVEPVAARMAAAMGSGIGIGDVAELPPGVPPEAAGLLAQAGPMFQRLGGGLLGMQLGQALGALAGEVAGAFDIGYPLAGAGAALLPSAVDRTARDTGIDPDEVRLFLALRELAHARLFASASWLAPTLLAGIERYAAGISVDVDRIREALSGADVSDPARLQEMLSSGILEPATSDEQAQALLRLEHLLALVEGWVQTVTAQAARAHIPHAEALLEHHRRLRAVGGPAEQAFGALVGLQLRPRRMREAAQWWARHGDVQQRDAVWAHPDLVPTDLDDQGGSDAPDQAAARIPGSAGEGTGGETGGAGTTAPADGLGTSEFDEELRRLLDGDTGPAGRDAPQEPPG